MLFPVCPALTAVMGEVQVGTADAFIVGVESCVYDEVNPDDRRGTLLVQVRILRSQINCISVTIVCGVAVGRGGQCNGFVLPSMQDFVGHCM